MLLFFPLKSINCTRFSTGNCKYLCPLLEYCVFNSIDSGLLLFQEGFFLFLDTLEYFCAPFDLFLSFKTCVAPVEFPSVFVSYIFPSAVVSFLLQFILLSFLKMS